MKSKLLLSLFILGPLLAACQPTTQERVVIPFADEVNTVDGNYTTLTEYSQLQALVDQEETFIIMIGNAGCGCTVEFLPVMREWIELHRVPTYYLEYTLLAFQTDKFDIPLVNTNVPILAIFDTGELAFSRTYHLSKSSENALFYDLDLLSAWFSERIILPNFVFLNKANFDALFTTQENMIVYIGRRTCPDCTYAFNTFMKPYLRNHPNTPTIYGLDVLDNEIWVPETGNTTPGWETFKTDYGMNNVLNTTFGYATGFVPTFLFIEGNGNTIKDDPSIIKDMIVTYNDSSRDSEGTFTQALTRTFFDGSRPLAYTTLNLTTLTLPVHSSTNELRIILEPYHNQAMEDFFTMYTPQIGNVA